MWNRPDKRVSPNAVDPRLEYARLVSELDKRRTTEESLPDGPPPVVDVDFCFDEEYPL